MLIDSKAVRARARRVARAIARSLLILFMVALAAVPSPVLPFIAMMLRPVNRNEPAMVVRRRRKKRF